MTQPISKISQNICSRSITFVCTRTSNRYNERRCCHRKYHQSFATNQTMKDVRKTLDKWMDFQEGFTTNPPDRSHLLKNLATTQEELPPRSMKDSFSTAIIPLSTELRLQHRYATVAGKLRMGRIMEDMDFFAVYIALKHIKNPRWEEGRPTPYVIVTAAVDNIEFTSDKPPVTNDVKLTGKVVNSGRTSMDVRIMLEKKMTNGWEKLTVANFVMVARNSTLTGPALVNKLVPDGPLEEKEYKQAVARRLQKTEADKASLLNSPPNLDEQKLIHNVFMKSVDLNDIGLNRRILPENCIWMEDSSLSSCFFPHPENRNHHNTVFGGYIIRLALELAWMTAYKYSSHKPSLRYITNICFKKSVSISQFMQIKSQVIYTHENYMLIVIFIEMLDIATRIVHTTHSLYVTYEVAKPVKSVIPKTYHEVMLWLEGFREFQKTSF